MNKYSFRIFGSFDAEDYAKAQTAVLAALQSLESSKVQSVELSQWESYPATEAKTAADNSSEK